MLFSPHEIVKYGSQLSLLQCRAILVIYGRSCHRKSVNFGKITRVRVFTHFTGGLGHFMPVRRCFLLLMQQFFAGFIFVRGLFCLCLRQEKFLVLRQGQLGGLWFGPRQFGLYLFLARPTRCAGYTASQEKDKGQIASAQIIAHLAGPASAPKTFPAFGLTE